MAGGNTLSRNANSDSCARGGRWGSSAGRQARIVLGGGNCLFTKLPTNFRAAHLLGGRLDMELGPGTDTAGHPGLSHGTVLGKAVQAEPGGRRLPAAAPCEAAGRGRAVGFACWGVRARGWKGETRVAPGHPHPRRVCTSAPCIHAAGDGWGRGGSLGRGGGPGEGSWVTQPCLHSTSGSGCCDFCIGLVRYPPP